MANQITYLLLLTNMFLYHIQLVYYLLHPQNLTQPLQMDAWKPTFFLGKATFQGLYDLTSLCFSSFTKEKLCKSLRQIERLYSATPVNNDENSYTV